MTRTRNRARRAPSLVWACAHARLEDRLLLSGSSAAAEVASSSAATASTPPGAMGAETVGWMGDLGSTTTAPQTTPANVDDSGGGGDFGVTLGNTGGGGSSPSPSSGLGGIFLGPTIGPTSPSGPQGGAFGPGTPDGPPPALIGDPVGPRSDGIQATVLEPMEDYYFAYSPLDGAAMGILPTEAGAACASMASIIGESGVEIVDLSDPPAVPQPTSPPAPSVRLPQEAEAVAADPPAAAGDPAPADPPATTEPEVAPADAPPISEAAPDPIGVGLRLSAPLVDVTGWDDALGRLVEGVDDLAEGLGDLGGPPATLHWVVAAGAMLVASEVARRTRARPRLSAAFVDGSASVVDPGDDPRDSLSRSVRRLLARGLSLWTTRR